MTIQINNNNKTILKIVYTSLLRVCKIHLTSIVDSFKGHGYGV